MRSSSATQQRNPPEPALLAPRAETSRTMGNTFLSLQDPRLWYLGQQPEKDGAAWTPGGGGFEFYSSFDEKPRQAELSAPLRRTLYFKPNPKHIFFSHIISSNNVTQLQEQFFAHIRHKLSVSYHFCSSSCAPLNTSCICINDSFCLHAFPVCILPPLASVPCLCHLPEKAAHPSSLLAPGHLLP